MFSACNYNVSTTPGFYGTPKNGVGFQIPKTGSNYAGFNLHKQNYWYGEYIETRLANVMNPNINYYVEFWVSLANESSHGIENVGVYFSVDTVHYSSNIAQIVDADIEYIGGLITDTMNWTRISGYYKPQKDGIKFITIGKFEVFDSTNVQLVNSNNILGAYYYIENVVVIDSALQHTIGIKETVTEPVEVKVYPNPACGIVNIEFSNRFDSEFEIQIFDIIGRKRYVKSFAFSKNLELDISELESGMYFIRIIGKSGSLISQKLIIE